VAESGSRVPLPQDPEKPVLRGEVAQAPLRFGEPSEATTNEWV
jgi:hypothetical protein